MSAATHDPSAGLPISRSGPLRERVKDALIELVISRQLAPGQHLVEQDIARWLQVSRQPVREALQALETEGWVDLHPGRGAFVHEPTRQEADEVFEVRVTLEAKAAGLAAHRITRDDLEGLRQICVEGRQAVADQQVDRVVELNAALHRRIAEHSGNRVLLEFLTALDRRVRWYFTPIAATRGSASWDEHDEIIEALAAGDSRGATRAMREHTTRSQRTFRQQQAQERS